MRILAVLLIVWLFLFAEQAKAGDVFTISGVHVDASADNALQAQTAAISDGQRRAANLLIERMSLASDRAKVGFGGVSQKDSAKMIRALSIANEKRSATRYLGDITVAFNKQAVEQYMKSRGLRMISTQAGERLVIPVFEGDAIWQDNIWTNAWEKVDISNSLTPMRVIKQNTDTMALKNANIFVLDMETLQKFGKIYGVRHILLVEANNGQAGITASIKDISLDSETSRNLGYVSAGTAKGAVLKIIEKLEEDWKSSVVGTDTGKTVILPVSVLYSSLSEWISLRDALDGAQQIKAAQIRSLSAHGADMRISFNGDMARLKNELSYKGLELRNDDKLGLVLGRAGR